MTESQVLKSQELSEIMALAAQKRLTAVMSHLANGRWRITNVIITMFTTDNLHVEVVQGEKPRSIEVQIDQPVGISFGHIYNKYLFETIITGFEPSVNQACGGKIVLELPKTVEKMQRREYTRAQVPGSLNIKVLFWHRGYNDERTEVPFENYWQGRLTNLSAGGVQIGVDLEQAPFFSVGQHVGLQFTPNPYARPLLLEGQVKHIEEVADAKKLYLGIHILGLEATSQGRKILKRIMAVVKEYQKTNKAEAEQTATQPCCAQS